MESEILEPMPMEKMEYFCEEVLKRDWPNSIHVYYFVKYALQWKSSCAYSEFKLLYLPNDLENGTFIGIRSQRFEHDYPDVVVAYTSPGYEEQFQRVLMSTLYIEWGKKPLFQAIPSRLMDIVLLTIKDRGMESEVHMNYLAWLPTNEADKISYKIPDCIDIDYLGEEHIDQIHSNWVLSRTHPKSDLLDTLRLNFGLGIFDRNERQLLAWAMCSSYGGLTALTVLPKFRGCGYGKLIAKAVTKKMGESGISPHAIVYQPNNIPLRLVESVGYVKLPMKFPFIFVKDRNTSGP